jgi:hypothetical protein
MAWFRSAPRLGSLPLSSNTSNKTLFWALHPSSRRRLLEKPGRTSLQILAISTPQIIYWLSTCCGTAQWALFENSSLKGQGARSPSIGWQPPEDWSVDNGYNGNKCPYIFIVPLITNNGSWYGCHVRNIGPSPPTKSWSFNHDIKWTKTDKSKKEEVSESHWELCCQ